MYRYVVVGAGSAGCTLANRLSEDPSSRVLLIEAGGSDRKLNIRIPVTFAKQFRTDLDWGYTSEPEPALIGRSIYLPRGRSLGGSSSMNAMIYMRGHRSIFDAWATERGAPGWSYLEVLPYFKRSEGNERLGGPYHSQSGPLNVTDPVWVSGLAERFVAAADAAGVGRTEDFNGAEQEGAGVVQVTQKRGRRWSAGRRVPAPDPQGARQPRGRLRGARAPDRVRRRPRRGRGVRAQGRGPDRTRRGRSGRLCGRVQLAPAAHALGHRAGRRAAVGRNRAARRLAPRRPPPRRPPDADDDVGDERGRHAVCRHPPALSGGVPHAARARQAHFQRRRGRP